VTIPVTARLTEALRRPNGEQGIAKPGDRFGNPVKKANTLNGGKTGWRPRQDSNLRPSA
jgi:hypothetical protein